MTLDEAFADARGTFLNFPEDAFTLWMDDRIRSNGWPPAGVEWKGFLDGRPISYWQGLRWHRQRVTLEPKDLSTSSFSLVMQLIDAALGKQNLVSSYIPDTTQRFKSCLHYVQANGTTPGLIMLLTTSQGNAIIDGSHRVAALLAFQSQLPAGSPLLFIEAWVASRCVA